MIKIKYFYEYNSALQKLYLYSKIPLQFDNIEKVGNFYVKCFDLTDEKNQFTGITNEEKRLDENIGKKSSSKKLAQNVFCPENAKNSYDLNDQIIKIHTETLQLFKNLEVKPKHSISHDSLKPSTSKSLRCLKCKKAIEFLTANPLPSTTWNSQIEMWTCHAEKGWYEQYAHAAKDKIQKSYGVDVPCAIKIRETGILYNSFYFIAHNSCFKCDCYSQEKLPSENFGFSASNFRKVDEQKLKDEKSEEKFEKEQKSGEIDLQRESSATRKKCAEQKESFATGKSTKSISHENESQASHEKNHKILFYNEIRHFLSDSQLIYEAFQNHFNSNNEYRISKYEIIKVADCYLREFTCDENSSDHKENFWSSNSLKNNGKNESKLKKAIKIAIKTCKDAMNSDTLNDHYEKRILETIEQYKTGIYMCEYEIGFIVCDVF